MPANGKWSSTQQLAEAAALQYDDNAAYVQHAVSATTPDHGPQS